MTKNRSDYDALHDLSRHTQTLIGVSYLLDWDQETHMPPAAAHFRADQLQAIAGVIHKERTGKPFKQALSKVIDIKTGKVIGKGLNPRKKRAVELWRHDFLQDTALPSSFVEEFTKLTSQAIEAWRLARKENAFQLFAPYLDKIVVMSRRKADLIGYKEHPYDALLDLYEPEATTREVSRLFEDLRKDLSKLLKKILNAKQVDDRFLFGKFDQDKQLEFGRRLLKDMGYDMSKGRLDLSTHPFSSSSHPTDSRITTRIHPTALMSNIAVVLHEGGHSLYEMGLPPKEFGSPLGHSISLGVHESQSRWWETRIGLSKPFWKYYLPLLQKTFKGKVATLDLDTFYKAINKIKPSLIRVESDEVTYSLHVILRFELEKALIEGKLSVRDIPEAWNAKMKELLGITPKTNREGCLQDIHWSMGAIGYFPTYTLGNLYASHLFLGFEKQNPSWASRVSKGELDFIREWLHDTVYRHGRFYSSRDLLKKATGKDFSAKAYIDYLSQKYAAIYS